VADEEIARVIAEAGTEVERTAESLVDEANGRGGEDNITVLLIQFQE
jgi:serine/threonine protein phosphatase PrpC